MTIGASQYFRWKRRDRLRMRSLLWPALLVALAAFCVSSVAATRDLDETSAARAPLGISNDSGDSSNDRFRSTDDPVTDRSERLRPAFGTTTIINPHKANSQAAEKASVIEAVPLVASDPADTSVPAIPQQPKTDSRPPTAKPAAAVPPPTRKVEHHTHHTAPVANVPAEKQAVPETVRETQPLPPSEPVGNWMIGRPGSSRHALVPDPPQRPANDAPQVASPKESKTPQIEAEPSDNPADETAAKDGAETSSPYYPQTWQWPLWKRIIIMIVVALAMIEFAIYTLTFLYCLFKMMLQSPTWSMTVMSVVIVVLWLVVRLLYLPFIYANIPLEELPVMPMVAYHVSFFFIALFFPLMLIAPPLAGIYSSFKYGLAHTKMADAHLGAEEAWKDVVVVMPVYNEEPAALWRAVQSVLESDYPRHKIRFYVSFDDEAESPLFLSLMRKLDCHPTASDGGFPPILQLVRNGVQLTVARFPHAGKRQTQAKTFAHISALYSELAGHLKPYVLFIDSDIILQRNAAHNFVCALERNGKLQAMTGYITCLTSRKNTTPSFLAWLQDGEYMSGQLFARNLESAFGAVTCLPGALTMIRLSALETVAPVYFGDLDTTSTVAYHRFHLGEDRYLTHLLMEEFPPHSIGFCFAASCKTEVPNTLEKYVKQRRRWLLGSFANEAYSLVSLTLWRKLPLVMVYKLLDMSARSVSFSMYIFLTLALLGYPFAPWLWMTLLLPLAVVWVLIIVYAVLLRRLKLVFMYPWMIFCNPAIYLWVNLYAIFKWNQRSWGGPRTKPGFFTQLTRSLSRSLSRRRRPSFGRTVAGGTDPTMPRRPSLRQPAMSAMSHAGGPDDEHRPLMSPAHPQSAGTERRVSFQDTPLLCHLDASPPKLAAASGGAVAGPALLDLGPHDAQSPSVHVRSVDLLQPPQSAAFFPQLAPVAESRRPVLPSTAVALPGLAVPMAHHVSGRPVDLLE